MRRRPSARVRANRRNAQYSTGPKTAAGKAAAAQNARLHDLRAAAEQFEPSALKIAQIVAGAGASPQVQRAAHAFAEGQSIVLRARRLQATAWSVLRDKHLSGKSLLEALDDPDFAAMVDPDARAKIRGDVRMHPKDLAPLRQIVKYVKRLRQKSADELARHLRLLNRYEGRGLEMRRSAVEELRLLRVCDEVG